jgi:hypothetical protein
MLAYDTVAFRHTNERCNTPEHAAAFVTAGGRIYISNRIKSSFQSTLTIQVSCLQVYCLSGDTSDQLHRV